MKRTDGLMPTDDGRALALALEEAYDKWKTGELAAMGNIFMSMLL